ncbi:hypothetical protein ACFVU2_19610 [Leifsonia sp. NPDC058194]|uniref:hypothetical protein n=1 Tax=Leifsonia sp. NPDC058194 TaxID=3346374 RepID=UPI0036DA84D4
MPATITEFERGARMGLKALDTYFRNEDSHLTIEARVEPAGGGDGWDMRRITDTDMEAYRAGALSDVLLEESRRASAEAAAVPAPAADASLDQVIGLMAEDKSNDWSEEIEALDEVATELVAARDQLEKYRVNVGSIENLVLTSRYARFGKFTAALLGSNAEWPGSEMLELIAEHWSRIDDKAIGGQSANDLAHWRKIADQLGVAHDGPDEEDDA